MATVLIIIYFSIVALACFVNGVVLRTVDGFLRAIQIILGINMIAFVIAFSYMIGISLWIIIPMVAICNIIGWLVQPRINFA